MAKSDDKEKLLEEIEQVRDKIYDMIDKENVEMYVAGVALCWALGKLLVEHAPNIEQVEANAEAFGEIILEYAENHFEDRVLVQ